VQVLLDFLRAGEFRALIAKIAEFALLCSFQQFLFRWP
jgi:hypothetical protein